MKKQKNEFNANIYLTYEIIILNYFDMYIYRYEIYLN